MDSWDWSPAGRQRARSRCWRQRVAFAAWNIASVAAARLAQSAGGTRLSSQSAPASRSWSRQSWPWRWATAVKGPDRGGVVIYHRAPRVDQVMDGWAAHLASERPDVTIEPRSPGDLVMNTRHVHERTGREYHVRHVIVSLYWNPKC